MLAGNITTHVWLWVTNEELKQIKNLVMTAMKLFIHGKVFRAVTAVQL
jgi:hypothetical protein